MSTVGIIAEFNPFHRGHEYIIGEARRITGADRCIAVMSGNFVQRGEPAVCDKFLRTRMALSCGVDAVFELPVPYATGSAEIFAEAGIKLLASLGCVDYVAFGSECGDLEAIMRIAEILVNEPDAYKDLLKTELKKGASFPAARSAALSAILPEASSVINTPNNILAVEYCKAIIKMRKYFGDRLHIPTPVTIRRIGSDYSARSIDDSGFASALSIRGALCLMSENTPDFAEIAGLLPSCSFEAIKASFKNGLPIEADDLSDMLHIRLATISDDELNATADVTGDFANAVRKYTGPVPAVSFTRMCETLKTKNITYSAVSRALLHIVLGIDKRHTGLLKNSAVLPYARLLGFNPQSSDILRIVSDNPDCILITKLGDARAALASDAESLALFETDLRAGAVYNQLIHTKFATPVKN